MTQQNQQRLGKTRSAIADQLRGAMNADDFRNFINRYPFNPASFPESSS